MADTASSFDEEFYVQLVLTLLYLFGHIVTIYYALINNYSLYQTAGLLLAELISIFGVLFIHVIITAEKLYYTKFERERNCEIKSLFQNGMIINNEINQWDQYLV